MGLGGSGPNPHACCCHRCASGDSASGDCPDERGAVPSLPLSPLPGLRLRLLRSSGEAALPPPRAMLSSAVARRGLVAPAPAPALGEAAPASSGTELARLSACEC